MALYNRGQLDPGASVASPGFRRASLAHYRADLDPARRQAQQELEDEYGSRGLERGGQSLAARLANRNSYVQNLFQQDQKLGMGQADLLEGDRQRVESRGWQTEDQAAQQAFEDEMMKWTEEDYANYRRSLPMKKLFGGIGKLGGAAASGQFNTKQYDTSAPKAPAREVA
jgi:hypothetical protein